MAKSARQRREYYENGRPGEVYGIWNGITKRFAYGIKEPTPKLAEQKLREVNPGGFRCWRYEWRKIPDGFQNPKNPIKYREA